MASEIPKEPIATDSQAVDPGRDIWALAIGRFLVAFTGCEYWMFLYVKTFGSEALHDALANQNLGPRSAVAKALVGDIGLKSEIQNRVDAAFKELAELAKQRNLVAHNPPMFHIYSDSQGQFHMKRELRSIKDLGKQISVAGLAELTARADKLDEEFLVLYGLVQQPESRAGGA